MAGAVIIGVGPGIGTSVARRFATAGMPLGLIARTAATVDAARAAVAAMAGAGGGTIVITGGMPEPDPAFTSLSLGKAGVRALTTLLASEYGPAGVHVATVTVSGAVAPGGRYDPDMIAEHYWRLHTQPPQAWEHEVIVAPDRVKT